MDKRTLESQFQSRALSSHFLNAKMLPHKIEYHWRPAYWPIHFTSARSLSFAVRICLYLALTGYWCLHLCIRDVERNE